MSRRFLFVILTLAIFLFSACGVKETVIEIQSISINQSTAEMEIGESLELKVTIFPGNATFDKIEWTTTDRMVASVMSDGVVTANSYGTCRIEVSVDGYSDYCDITVSAPLPEINWENNAGFEQVELTAALDANISVLAPGKIQDLKLVLNLGANNSLVNQYIKIQRNKSMNGSNPVMDLVEDDSSANLLGGLGMRVGSSLRGKTELKLDLQKILERILMGQPVENNSTFTIEVLVTDQFDNTISKIAKFHYTAAPEITWPKNPTFATVELDAANMDCNVKVWAPGKIVKMTVTLEDGAAPALVSFVKRSTTGGTAVIDLVNDKMVKDSFKNWFPAGDAVASKEQVVLDFGFMFQLKYDMEPSTNSFIIVVEDKNGKQTVQPVIFRKR